jgi:hypothetical protein
MSGCRVRAVSAGVRRDVAGCRPAGSGGTLRGPRPGRTRTRLPESGTTAGTAHRVERGAYMVTGGLASPGGAFGDLDRRDVQDQDQDADLTATSTWVLLIRTTALPGRHPLRQ